MPRAPAAAVRPFEKLFSTITKTDLVRLAGLLDVEASGTTSDLRRRIKPHLATNIRDLIDDPIYTRLFSNRDRGDLRRQSPEQPPGDSEYPPSWHGVRRSTPTTSGVEEAGLDDGPSRSVVSMDDQVANLRPERESPPPHISY